MSAENLVDTTKSYYDSQDADEFYHTVWGGEDIHVGIYKSDEEPIFEASRRTAEAMIARLPKIDEDTTILDIGAGYGGAARYLAKKFGCHVTCLNLSDKENERNDEKNKDQGLADLIDVKGGNFEDLPFDENSFDIVWCQDSILHSDNKEQVFREVHRVLHKGGLFIFTDPMQSDDCPDGVLDPILERIHLREMGSVKKYRKYADELGMEIVEIEEMPEQLVNHYSRVQQELQKKKDKLSEVVSQDYIERMHKGLSHWVEGGKNDYLNWGIIVLKK